MNSSIFNSNSASSETNSMTSSRKIYAKTLLAIGFCMFVAMSIINVTLMQANERGVLGRVSEARAALPRILKEPDDLVMFYGSSMVRAGFSPRHFDQSMANRGKKVTSFNFGFGGLNPYFQDLLSRRIAEQFRDSNRRLKLVMIEFNPFQATQTRWNRAAPALDSFLTALANDSELAEIAKRDITRGVRLFNIKYLRNNISAQMITSYFGRQLFPGQSYQVFKDNEQVIAELQRVTKRLSDQFDKEYPDYVDAQWQYSWQGGGTIPQERSAETLALFAQYDELNQIDTRMKNNRLMRIRTADIEELNFEPLLIEHFIETVKNFQGIADNVEVILLPKNSKWIHTTPEANQRLTNAINQIEHVTGISVKDHQNIPEITPEMFRDTTHLSRYSGDIPYTDFLVESFVERL